MIQLTVIIAIRNNNSFETEMMRDCPLSVVIGSVHMFHFVKLGCKFRFNKSVERLSNSVP